MIEIEPGVLVSKLDIKDGDTIVVTLDFNVDWIDLNTGVQYLNGLAQVFPNNSIVLSFKGMEFEVRREEKK